MKDFLLGVVGFMVLVLTIYFLATLFRSEPTNRGVPTDMVGYCTNSGDCY